MRGPRSPGPGLRSIGLPSRSRRYLGYGAVKRTSFAPCVALFGDETFPAPSTGGLAAVPPPLFASVGRFLSSSRVSSLGDICRVVIHPLNTRPMIRKTGRRIGRFMRISGASPYPAGAPRGTRIHCRVPSNSVVFFNNYGLQNWRNWLPIKRFSRDARVTPALALPLFSDRYSLESQPFKDLVQCLPQRLQIRFAERLESAVVNDQLLTGLFVWQPRPARRLLRLGRTALKNHFVDVMRDLAQGPAFFQRLSNRFARQLVRRRLSISRRRIFLLADARPLGQSLVKPGELQGGQQIESALLVGRGLIWLSGIGCCHPLANAFLHHFRRVRQPQKTLHLSLLRSGERRVG